MAITFPTVFQSAIATDPAATAAGYLTPTRYNQGCSVAGLGTNQLLYSTDGTTLAQSANLTFDGTTLSTTRLGVAAGTLTTDVQIANFSATWNASGVTFEGLKLTITDTASAAGSLALDILGGSGGTTVLLQTRKDAHTYLGASGLVLGTAFNSIGGQASGAGFATGVNGYFSWAPSTNYGSTGDIFNVRDTQLTRGGANQIVHSGATGAAGAATSRAEINKAVTAFTDAVAKTVFTLTIPNAAHSASYLVRVTGSIGAGGAIGANEASATNAYIVTLCRTAGVNAVGTISAAFGSAASNVAGATTVTCTAALAAVAGGVTATNTIDIQATITKAGGLSDNHTCVATASLLNANATGITIA